jgi:hypothetical protein
MLELLITLRDSVIGGEPDRGDVPGWVLIAIMTAGVVTALWAFMGSTFVNLFTDAINSVKGP